MVNKTVSLYARFSALLDGILDALIATAVAQHYGLEPKRAMQSLFPESRGAPVGQVLARG